MARTRGSSASPADRHRPLLGASIRKAARSLSPWRRTSGDKHPETSGPPVASVVVQPSKLYTSLERNRTEEESWSLGDSAKASSSSESNLVVLMDDDEGEDDDAAETRSNDTLTEDTLTEDTPLVQDELDAVAKAALPCLTEKDDVAASSLMPVMELLVQTILDDPSAKLTRSACVEAVLGYTTQKVELQRLRAQVQELSLQNQQYDKYPSWGPGIPGGRGGATSWYQVRDLSALHTLRDSQKQAQMRLRESYIKYWGAPPPQSSPFSLHPPPVVALGAWNDKGEEDPRLRGDYSEIIPLDSNRSDAGSASSAMAVADPSLERRANRDARVAGADAARALGDIVKNRSSPPSVAPTLPTAVSSDDTSCENSCGNSDSNKSSDTASSSSFTAAVVMSEQLNTDERDRPTLLDTGEDCSHVSERLMI